MRKGSIGCRLVVLVLLHLISNCLTAPGNARADEDIWDVGLRGGWSFNGGEESFNQVDIHTAHRLPRHWELWDGINLDSRFVTALGVLNGGGDTGLLGSLGLETVIGGDDNAFEVRVGCAATLMSDYTYGDEDFGGPFQFTSHIGLEYAFRESMSAMVRVQHMSNAGIYSSNPGVNLVMIGLRYQF